MTGHADDDSLTEPWGEVHLPADAPVTRRIGSLVLWLVHRQGEIRLAYRRTMSEADRGGDHAATDARPLDSFPNGSEPPDDDDPVWARWALSAATTQPGKDPRVLLKPALSERSLVVHPGAPFSLLPRAEARIFVRVPLGIRADVLPALPTADSDHALFDPPLPTAELSDTWWGGVKRGELCSWLPTKARRAVGPEHLEPDLAICPLHLMNHSSHELRVERICLRVRHLTLFSDGPGFWTDESRVLYEGEGIESRIDMTGRAPDAATTPRLVSTPPMPVRGLRALTFTRLRELSGLGGVS